jgi:hypothetical protein
MSSPTYEYTSIPKIIARAKVRLKITASNTADVDLFLKDCVIEAAKQMSTAEDFIEKTTTLPIVDYRAELPCDFFTFDRGNIGNQPIVFTRNGTAVITASTPSVWNIIETGQPFVTNSPYNENSNITFPVINIQDGYIYFSTNVEESECTISYLAVNLDENGDVKIPENNARAIMNYAMSEYCLANGMPVNMWQEYRRIWTNGKMEQRGRSKLLDSFGRERLKAIMNRVR